jgi:glutathione transport system permease protein
MFIAPHLMIFPGMMIFVTVLAANLLGDALRDVLDPRQTLKGAA